MVDAGAERLVDDDLQGRRVTDRQQLLGDRLDGGQEAGAHAGGRDHCAAYLHGPDDSLPSSMPTYVYRFVDTGETIEVQQAFTDDALTEATHPETGDVMPVKKVFTPVGVTFKGGGFYKTDSRRLVTLRPRRAVPKDGAASIRLDVSSSSTSSTTSSPRRRLGVGVVGRLELDQGDVRAQPDPR